MIEDKLRSLKKALWYSYQSDTIELADGRQFRALINDNKETVDYDNKIISIPFEDKCVKDEQNIGALGKKPGTQVIGMKPGDVFTWLRNDTHWLVFLEYLSEKAYFMAEIRKCEQEIDLDGHKYWVYIRGPVETKIVWNQKAGIEWNDLNYSAIIYITRDEFTINALKRHKRLKLKHPVTNTLHSWKVVAVNPYHGDGVIEVCLLEDYENHIEDEVIEIEKAEEQEKLKAPVPSEPFIDGKAEVEAYDQVEYSIKNYEQPGHWYLIRGSRRKELVDGTSVKITIDHSSGELVLGFENDELKIEKIITINNF